MDEDFLNQLPDEVKEHLSKILDIKSLVRMSRVSKSWLVFFGTSTTWRKLFEEYFPGENILINEPNSNWRTKFISILKIACENLTPLQMELWLVVRNKDAKKLAEVLKK